MDDDDNKKSVNRLLDLGGEISSSASMAALSLLASGRLEGVIFAACAPLVKLLYDKVGGEISKRLLSPRENARIGSSLAFTVSKIKEKIEQGHRLRDDDFFSQKENRRCNAEEVLESVLLKCQREPEERKIEYISNLLANICLDKKISVYRAHQLIKSTERLTYRQFCLLKMFAVQQNLRTKYEQEKIPVEKQLRMNDYRGSENYNMELLEILYECFDLYSHAYINIGGDVAFGPGDIKPGVVTVQGLGVYLHNLMELGKIPNEDIEPIRMHLRE